MGIKVLGKTKDLRSNTWVVYAKTSIDDYLNLVGDNFDDFEIQRRREKHNAYKRMKEDIIAGALLPPITLAIKPEFVANIIRLQGRKNPDALENAVSKPGRVNILDGLQRTYILKDLKREGHHFKDGQELLLEFWLEKDIKHLIYRLIVLNAGQKPMSLRHQVELLFATIKEKLESDISDLEIFAEKEGSRRNKPGKFAFVKLVSAYQCYLTRSPEINKDNFIAQQLSESSVLDADEITLENQFISFTNYMRTYVELDKLVYKVYNGTTTVHHNRANWLADDNVICSFFAAISDFGTNEKRLERIDKSLIALKILLERSKKGSDPLGLKNYEDIRDGLNPKKQNIGYSTRKLLMNGFKEFFREEGEAEFNDCWIAGA